MDARMQQAEKFYKDFHWGDEPDKFVEAEFPRAPKVATKLGALHEITYETTKDGETALWTHEFGEEGGNRPDLVVDVSNQQLHIVGGDYTVEPRGIVD